MCEMFILDDDDETLCFLLSIMSWILKVLPSTS